MSIIAALKIQKEELKYLKDMFINMDKDNNGHLSVSELREGYNGRCMFELFMDHKHNHDDPEEDFEILMQELDLDKDGELDYQEFL